MAELVAKKADNGHYLLDPLKKITLANVVREAFDYLSGCWRAYEDEHDRWLCAESVYSWIGNSQYAALATDSLFF